MMRIIKFRAWHKEKDWADEVVVYHDGSWSATYGTVSGYDDKDGVILMQFTGLVDRNGKEVYEGDIVKTIDGYFALVSYDNNKAEFNPFGSREGAEWGDGVEIIGNIWENPGLVEVP